MLFSSVSYSRPLSVPQLEQVYWICDYTSSLRMLSPNETEYCTSILDQLKIRKFDGNWEEYVKWRNDNKLVEYAKIESKK